MCLCDWWTKLLRSVQKQNNKKNPTTSFLWYSCVCCYDDILMQNHTNPTEIMYDLLLYALDCTLCVIYCLPLHQIFVWCNVRFVKMNIVQVISSVIASDRERKKEEKRVKKKEFCTVARQKKNIYKINETLCYFRSEYIMTVLERCCGSQKSILSVQVKRGKL